MARFATWFRFLYNRCEPNNEIKLTAELKDDGKTYAVFEVWGSLTFNDGHLFLSINRSKDGKFLWKKGDEAGISASFADAWKLMPTYITNSDHYEESPMTYHDLITKRP